LMSATRGNSIADTAHSIPGRWRRRIASDLDHRLDDLAIGCRVDHAQAGKLYSCIGSAALCRAAGRVEPLSPLFRSGSGAATRSEPLSALLRTCGRLLGSINSMPELPIRYCIAHSRHCQLPALPNFNSLPINSIIQLPHCQFNQFPTSAAWL